jgi:hypothetical protein
VTVSEIYIEGVNEGNQDFLWENMANYMGQREAFSNVSRPQSSVKYVSDLVEYFRSFLAVTSFNIPCKKRTGMDSNIRIQELNFSHFDHQ